MAMASCSRAACRPCAARLISTSQQATWHRCYSIARPAVNSKSAGRTTSANILQTCLEMGQGRQGRQAIIGSRLLSSSAKQTATDSTSTQPTMIEVLGQQYARDDYTNLSQTILARVAREPQLPVSHSHPLNLLRRQIEASMPTFTSVTPPSPVVSVEDNFGKLGFPENHPGRNPTDTYYINRRLCLRTHTSTHEVDTFAKGHTQWLLTADVFRRDEIDASHYPIFHQMEGASIWELEQFESGGQVQRECEQMENRLSQAKIAIEDNVDLQDAGGYQPAHQKSGQTKHAAELATRHLKATLNNLALDLFGERHAEDVRNAGGDGSHEPLKVRWIAAEFPFTSPSFEVEVWFRGEWLEILGCGVVQQRTLDEANVRGKLGWAFGLGLERIAMVLFQIPDIRFFWSRDPRFLSQFSNAQVRQSMKRNADKSPAQSAGVSAAGGAHTSSHHGEAKLPLITFKPYSKYPPCYKDASFWLPKTGAGAFHENDVFEIIRDIAGDLTENVTLIDDFVHPKTGRHSKCFRINYRSMDRSLENEEVNALHAKVTHRLVEQMGVELR